MSTCLTCFKKCWLSECQNWNLEMCLGTVSACPKNRYGKMEIPKTHSLYGGDSSKPCNYNVVVTFSTNCTTNSSLVHPSRSSRTFRSTSSRRDDSLVSLSWTAVASLRSDWNAETTQEVQVPHRVLLLPLLGSLIQKYCRVVGICFVFSDLSTSITAGILKTPTQMKVADFCWRPNE